MTPPGPEGTADTPTSPEDPRTPAPTPNDSAQADPAAADPRRATTPNHSAQPDPAPRDPRTPTHTPARSPQDHPADADPHTAATPTPNHSAQAHPAPRDPRTPAHTPEGHPTAANSHTATPTPNHSTQPDPARRASSTPAHTPARFPQDDPGRTAAPAPAHFPEHAARTAAAGPAPRPATPGDTLPPGPAGIPGPAAPDSTPQGSGTPQGTGTARTPDRARLVRRARRVLAFVAVLAAGATALAVLNSGTRHGFLDPRSADPYGSRAVAELLDDRGVTTRVVTTAREAADAAGPGTTLLITEPDRLSADRRDLIRSAMDLSGGRTVLLAPGAPSLPGLAPGVAARSATGADTLAPACALPAAVSAGRAATGDDLRYTTDLPRATACYPSDGDATLLVLPAGTGGDTVLLGSATLLLNENLAEEGNASLALHLLGSRPELVWYMPSPADSDPAADGAAEDKGLLDLIPAGWSWALLQLFVAAALAALWRARRLGPLVTERLPVAIRASEATEGRARLYRKAGARDRASTVLRAAARERLAALTGVPAAQAHDPLALIPAVSSRLAGNGRDATATLFGPTPSDDAALVALADHLDALEREVRTS